ncbi:hypothetical protein T11_12582 [Trichinella zimbabwensis]|uniref:Uncharacterized protein n=1 Tax=Trichinella zimbabwensis TaxID=268475 RepID=A0A0V1H454_9BILA|nr:hypothetical protein T11_12582 [Trichinella zimbabwensis]
MLMGTAFHEMSAIYQRKDSECMLSDSQILMSAEIGSL